MRFSAGVSRSLVATLVAAGPVLVGVGPVSAVPDSEELARADGADRADLLLSLGLNREAERLLRARLAAGDAGARAPLVYLLLRRGRGAEASDLLRGWGGPEALGGDQGGFTWGRLGEVEGRWVEAAEAFVASAEREPLLSDHAAFRAGIAFEELGRTAQALDFYERAGEAARNRDLSARAFWSAAALAARAGEADRALEDLERIPPRSIIPRADLLELHAAVHRALGNAEREARALRELLDRAPSSEQAVEAIERLSVLETPRIADRIAFAEAALRNRHPTLAEDHALRALMTLAENPEPEPGLEGKARVQYGKSLMARNRLTAARAELARVPARADPEDRAEALLDRARCLWKLGQIDACLAEYDRIADGDLPEEFRATAAWEAAREAKDDQRWEEAALRLAEFQRVFPDHEYADDALWHRGRALAELGRKADAIASFEHLRTRYHDSPFVEEGSYWIANLHRQSGRADSACAEFEHLLRVHPDSYWSERARKSLADHPCTSGAPAAPVAPEDPVQWLAQNLPGVDPAASPARVAAILRSESFRRASALARVGLVPEAESELKGLRLSLDRDPAALLALAERAWRIGVPRTGMRAVSLVKARTGKAILSGETPAAVARLLYPVEHLDSVLRWSAEYELDPLFVYAVMREESWFDARAVSWVGALGLLQIMPSTGRDLARRVGLEGYDRTDLFDPDVNIHLGAFYLRALLDELDREPALALSAYNAGKHNALRWRNGLNGDFDVDRYVAGITYRETYNYVQKVTRSWAIYRHLYADMLSRLEEIHRGTE